MLTHSAPSQIPWVLLSQSICTEVEPFVEPIILVPLSAAQLMCFSDSTTKYLHHFLLSNILWGQWAGRAMANFVAWACITRQWRSPFLVEKPYCHTFLHNVFHLICNNNHILHWCFNYNLFHSCIIKIIFIFKSLLVLISKHIIIKPGQFYRNF